MNSTTNTLLLSLAALCMTVVDAPAQSVSTSSRAAGQASGGAVQHRQQMAFVNDGDRAVAITVDGDTISARIDGREIPPDRIRRENGRVIILDEDGKPIEGLDFAVSSNGAFGIAAGQGMQDLTFFREPLPVMMGVTMNTTSPALEHHLRLDAGATTMITGVYEGLPAHEAGLSEFDIIVAIDGERLAAPSSIRAHLRDRSPGETVRLEVIQEGKRRDVRLRLVENDPEALRDATYLGSAGPDVAFFRPGGQFGGPVPD
ncbi:MAG: PDZ domain-containing protein, partial [Planctomycetota bacterium]